MGAIWLPIHLPHRVCCGMSDATIVEMMHGSCAFIVKFAFCPREPFYLSHLCPGAVLRNIGVSKPEIEAIMEDVRRQHLDEQSSAVELLAGDAAEDGDGEEGAEKSDYDVDGRFRVRDAKRIAAAIKAVLRNKGGQRADSTAAVSEMSSDGSGMKKVPVPSSGVAAVLGNVVNSETTHELKIQQQHENLQAPSLSDD